MLDEAEMCRQTEEGEERKALSQRSDDCPMCGKPLDVEDPYLSADEDELLEWDDASDGLRRFDLYCLDCEVNIREVYRLERRSAEVVRHGMGSQESERCPNCGSPNADYSLRPAGNSSWSLLCECRDCGCEFRLNTEEQFNHSWVIADRDGFYAGSDYEQLHYEPVAKIGGECPMCGRGVVAAAPGFLGSSPNKWLRGERCVDYECLSCLTQFTDHFITRVVGVEVIRQGRLGFRWVPPAEVESEYDDGIPF